MKPNRWLLAVLFLVVFSMSSVAAQDTLDPGAEPNYGFADLGDGFAPAPFTVAVVAGGDIPASVVGDCAGFVTRQPDFRLNWNGGGFLRFAVRAPGGEDATLVVYQPDGNFYCNDDTFGLNPAVDVFDAPAGEYAVWVGTFREDNYFEAQLFISQLERFDPTAQDGRGETSTAQCTDIIAVSELQVERVDDQTAFVYYANPSTGQEFQLTVIGAEAEIVETYLNETALCLVATGESGGGTGVPAGNEVVDIPFGDFFFDVLDEAGANVDELVAARDEGQFQETSLRDVLARMGIDGEEVLRSAFERANTAIDEAVASDRLTDARARQARSEVETMYSQFLDLPDLVMLAGGRRPAPTLLEIEIAVTNLRDNRGEWFTITLVEDPSLGYGWTRARSYTLAQARSAKVNSFCITTGSGSAYMYLNNSYRWGGYDTTNASCASSGWYTANRLYIVGWSSSNSFRQNSTFAVEN